MSTESDESSGSNETIVDLSEPRKLLFAKEVAARWRLTTQTLAMWRERGVGPKWFKIGDNIRYYEDSVLEFEKAGIPTVDAAESQPGQPENKEST